MCVCACVSETVTTRQFWIRSTILRLQQTLLTIPVRNITISIRTSRSHVRFVKMCSFTPMNTVHTALLMRRFAIFMRMCLCVLVVVFVLCTFYCNEQPDKNLNHIQNIPSRAVRKNIPLSFSHYRAIQTPPRYYPNYAHISRPTH